MGRPVERSKGGEESRGLSSGDMSATERTVAPIPHRHGQRQQSSSRPRQILLKDQRGRPGIKVSGAFGTRLDGRISLVHLVNGQSETST
jgi:hypothetical protein